jgi:putative hydrolases of HD superfamily
VATAESVVLHLLSQTNALKQLPRTGWLFAGIGNVESIADHTCVAGLLSIFLANLINQEPGAHGLDTPINTGRLVQIVLLHDLAECLVTDLPRRTADLMTKAVKHEIEAHALDQILLGLPGSEELKGLWEDYNQGLSAEGKLARDVDKLELAYQTLCYERLGNQNLEEFWCLDDWHYDLCKRIFATIGAQRPRGLEPGRNRASNEP